MIRIYKPKIAPAKLRKQGTKKAASHLADYNQNRHEYETGEKQFPFSRNIYADPTVKDALIAAQHGKCCFCERLVGGDGDVEHFRPKSGYWQNKGQQIQKPGYYWLAYNWDNLYLSCKPCNQSYKLNLFPLSDPQKRAHLHNNDISQEEPLLVDPGKEEPTEHISFRREVAFPVPESIKGEVTIEILQLNRDVLNKARFKHLDKMKALYEVTKIATSEPDNIELQELAQQAEKILQNAISDKAEFAAATREALKTEFTFIN
jgi:uncharacterized protein (TIGR02646 family)